VPSFRGGEELAWDDVEVVDREPGAEDPERPVES
jgi:hypothetical protein